MRWESTDPPEAPHAPEAPDAANAEAFVDRCDHCGHDLSGSPSVKCSECGARRLRRGQVDLLGIMTIALRVIGVVFIVRGLLLTLEYGTAFLANLAGGFQPLSSQWLYIVSVMGAPLLGAIASLFLVLYAEKLARVLTARTSNSIHLAIGPRDLKSLVFVLLGTYFLITGLEIIGVVLVESWWGTDAQDEWFGYGEPSFVNIFLVQGIASLIRITAGLWLLIGGGGIAMRWDRLRMKRTA